MYRLQMPSQEGHGNKCVCKCTHKGRTLSGADLQENRTPQKPAEPASRPGAFLCLKTWGSGALHRILGCQGPRDIPLSPELLSPLRSLITPPVPKTLGPGCPTPAALFLKYRGFRSPVVSPGCGLTRRLFFFHLYRS